MAMSLILLLSSNYSLAQRKKMVKAYLDHKVFYQPNVGAFVEVHLQFSGYSLAYVQTDAGLQSELAIQYLFKNDQQMQVAGDAYRLQSPIMRDSIIEDFYEIKRIPLPPGSYNLELSIADLNREGATPVTAIQQIVVPNLAEKPSLSNLEMAEVMYQTGEQQTVFSKSGYEIIPRISNYYPAQSANLPVYFEVYNPKPDSDTVPTVYGLKQVLRDTKTKQELESYTRFSKLEVQQILPIIRVLDINKLPTGEYELSYSLLDQNNTELSISNYYFDRFNDEAFEVSTDEIVLNPAFQNSIKDDSLAYYVASLIPISRSAEMKNIIKLLKTKDKELYRKYLQSYWTGNTTGGEQAYGAWMAYKTQVEQVERLYGTNFTAGYETDRGRIYLQYGSPSNIITRENSPSEYPYEIWRYDKIKTYSNKRFIFYNPDLVNNMYQLLHSDMIGEVQNYRWQQQLSKRNSTNGTIDDGNAGNKKHFGGNSSELFNQY